MKVILREDVKNLGTMGEIVEVKPGFARNFLLPNKLVEIATPAVIKNWELGAARRQKKIEAELADAKAAAAKLDGIVLPYTKTINIEGIVFGSVTKADVQKSLAELGHKITKDHIEIHAPIKKIGETEVAIYFKPTVYAKIKVKIDAVEEDKAGK
ncbi:MAG: 50S ribosomal protein L9 [Elusimicrobiota bacterium]|jgi:large subunit ribosomal protein L9|nr:50S ribosomal protein L9 [Elusimicrobiota bacterium]